MSPVLGCPCQKAHSLKSRPNRSHVCAARLSGPRTICPSRLLRKPVLLPTTAARSTSAIAEADVQVTEEPEAVTTQAPETLDVDEQEAAARDAAAAAAAAEAAKRIFAEELRREVARRRNFAIISHPDAGKTTLTEKLLLYGGAIHEAGEVKSRKSKKFATSDWMELEKQRGISITSTAMTFEYNNVQINLLDTPGHQDFSEDTYRTLAAADNAVMLVDAAKGLETQTRKLFQVARMRNVPIFTFVNKMDRPAMDPFEIMQQIEKEFGLKCYAANWPIGSGDQFRGVWHRPSNKVVLFERLGAEGRRKGAVKQEYDWGDPALASILEPHLYEQLLEEAELLEALGEPLDLEKVAKAELTPMFFGSAVTNFGVELFLQTFIQWAATPSPSPTRTGVIEPTSEQFSGLVFKLQANMDPKHRDKVAFIRVVSGKFEKGMKVKVARTGRVMALSRPQRMFANDRSTVQEGFAGDVIGLTNPGAFAIGDTVHTGSTVAFPPIPSFSPELFAYMRCAPNARKPFLKGIEGLLGEGAVQVLYSTDEYITDPILAAVGQLQFEVVQYRMKDEYGVDTTMDPMPYTIARWVVGGWPAVERAGRLFNTTVVRDMYKRPVLLFRNEFALTQVLNEARDKLGELSPYALPPDV